MNDKPLKIADVWHQRNLHPSTLNDWIDYGVCIKTKIKFPGQRSKIWGLEPVQLDRLDRFLKYREWMMRRYNTEKIQVPEIVYLLDAIDDGDFEQVIRTLTEIEQDLDDKISEIREEIGLFHAMMHEEETNNP